MANVSATNAPLETQSTVLSEETFSAPRNTKIGEPGYPPDFDSLSFQSEWSGGKITKAEVRIIEPHPSEKPAVNWDETLSQNPRKAFVLYDGNLPVNLLVEHGSREIIVQALIGKFSGNALTAEQVNPVREQVATKLLGELHRKLDGRLVNAWRLVTGARAGFLIEGPEIEADRPVLRMSVKVAGNTNFDEIYGKIDDFLSSHRHNDDCPRKPARLLHSFDSEGNHVVERPYLWTREELEAVASLPLEHMADHLSEKDLDARFQRAVRLRKESREKRSVDEKTPASEAAGRALNWFFWGR